MVGALVGRPRCERIFLITCGSSMLAMIFICLLHALQVLTSILKTRLRSLAHLILDGLGAGASSGTVITFSDLLALSTTIARYL